MIECVVIDMWVIDLWSVCVCEQFERRVGVDLNVCERVVRFLM